MRPSFWTGAACLLLLLVLTSGALSSHAAPSLVQDAQRQDDSRRDDEEDGIGYDEDGHRDGRWNVVRVRNRSDDRLRIRGNIQLNRIGGPEVEPVNIAEAFNSCTDCQSIAVALQLNLISRTADRVVPVNRSQALNAECTRCLAVSRALQYVISVDDPHDVPREVTRLIREMDRELQHIHSDRRIGLVDAESRINAVIAEFRELAESLDDQRTEDTSGGGAATPTATSTPASAASTASPTQAATAAATSGASPTALPAATATPQAATAGPTSSASATLLPVGTAAPTPPGQPAPSGPPTPAGS